MECPKCGNNMEMIFYDEDGEKYIHFVCYVCALTKEEMNETSVGMPYEFA